MPSALAAKVRAKFPGAYDDMDDATLEKSVLAKHPEYQDLATPSQPESFMGSALKTLGHGALDALPGIGAVVGGVLSTPETGGMGTIPGIALGAGAGRGVRDLIAAGLGMEKPATMATEAGRIGGETALTAGTAAVMPGAVMAAKTPVQTLRDASEHFGSALPAWARRIGKVLPSLPEATPGPVLERPAWQTWGDTAPSEAAPTATAAQTASSGISDAEKVLLAKKYPGLDPAKVEQQMTGRLQMAPTDRPPITVSPNSPMQAPRVDVGAEVVGRQNGLTTQAVRDQTGPIRGEAQGAAAGMPNKPMDRIVQKLIDMGPKGQGLPESARESYAAAGNSDKTRLQVQAYLDALRKVGFVGGAAAAPALIKGRLVKMPSQEQ